MACLVVVYLEIAIGVCPNTPHRSAVLAELCDASIRSLPIKLKNYPVHTTCTDASIAKLNAAVYVTSYRVAVSRPHQQVAGGVDARRSVAAVLKIIA